MSAEANEVSVDNSGEQALLAFPPLHKRAFGLACGLTMGSSLFILTSYCVIRSEPPGLIYLLSNYFPGYDVSWTGALVGFAWGTFTFFVAGWFLAFSRNLVLATSIWVIRTRAELGQTRDFLDHV